MFIEILQADAGTRTTGINAASLALADAGIPMRNLVSACAVGKVDGEIVLDLMKEEDNCGEADMPVAMTPRGEITLIQMDGRMTQEEFIEALKLAIDGCKRIYQMQREALINRYERGDEERERKESSEVEFKKDIEEFKEEVGIDDE